MPELTAGGPAVITSPVAFFDYVTHYGGAQRSTVELVKRLRSVLDVHVWDAYGSSPEYLDALRRSDTPAHILLPEATYQAIGLADRPIRRVVRFARSLPEQSLLAHRLRSRIRTADPTVIWTNSRKGFSLLTAVAPRKQRLVYFLRGGEMSVPSTAFVHGVLRPRAAQVLVLTNAIASMMAERGYPRDRISVVPNAIAIHDVVNRSQLPLKDELSQKHRRVRLLMAATLVPNKGQLEAVRVLHQLVGKGVDAVLYLAGDVPGGDSGNQYAERVRQLAVSLEVDDRVVFLGWRTDGPAVLRESSVLLVLSASEGVPRVILEAMAIGVPVVATPVGGVRDLVRDHETGWLVARDDAQSVAEAVLEAIASDRSTRIVRAAREHVERNFSPECQLDAALSAFRTAGNVRHW